MRKAQRLLQRATVCRECTLVESCQRFKFSTAAPTSAVEAESPTHASQSYEVETIQALPRDRAGRLPVKQYRKANRVPAILFSLPGETSELISLGIREADYLMRTYGRRGITSRLFSLQLVDEAEGTSKSFPVLPKMVHVDAVTEKVENITFMYCPPERIVNVKVVVKILGEDVSPGIKKGGFVKMIRRTIKCRCLGNKIPENIEVDVSGLELGEKVGLDALNLPLGVGLAEKHLVDPICKIAGRAARS